MPNLKRYYVFSFMWKSTWNGEQEQNLFSTFINLLKIIIQHTNSPTTWISFECQDFFGVPKWLGIYEFFKTFIRSLKILAPTKFSKCPKVLSVKILQIAQNSWAKIKFSSTLIIILGSQEIPKLLSKIKIPKLLKKFQASWKTFFRNSL